MCDSVYSYSFTVFFFTIFYFLSSSLVKPFTSTLRHLPSKYNFNVMGVMAI